jgi:hypothetical protein
MPIVSTDATAAVQAMDGFNRLLLSTQNVVVLLQKTIPDAFDESLVRAGLEPSGKDYLSGDFTP